MQPRSRIEISKSALSANIDSFRSLLTDRVILAAVVKANAYGHGLMPVSLAIEDKTDIFAVDSLDEAEFIFNRGIAKPILIMGYTPVVNLSTVVKNDFRQVIYDRETLQDLAKEARSLNKKAYVHLKIETGTNRQGVNYEEIPYYADYILQNKDIVLEGIYTHFADVESGNDFSFARMQLARYLEAVKLFQARGIRIPLQHIASTAALLLLPETHLNMVRLGIGLYGLWPSEYIRAKFSENNKQFKLLPVLSWKSIIAQIKNVRSGEAIGYGLSERVDRDSRIAVIPQGYADGYDRKLSSRGEVLIRGKRAKVLGRICMNMMMVDITEIREAQKEEEVVIFGKQGNDIISAEELAQKTNTISYEIVSRINPFIPREVID